MIKGCLMRTLNCDLTLATACWDSPRRGLCPDCLQKTLGVSSWAECVQPLGHPGHFILFQRTSGLPVRGECCLSTAEVDTSWNQESSPRALPAEACGCFVAGTQGWCRLSVQHAGSSFKAVGAVRPCRDLKPKPMAIGLLAQLANLRHRKGEPGRKRSEAMSLLQTLVLHTHFPPGRLCTVFLCSVDFGLDPIRSTGLDFHGVSDFTVIFWLNHLQILL